MFLELSGIISGNNGGREGQAGDEERPGCPGSQWKDWECRQLDRPVTGKRQGPRKSKVSRFGVKGLE